jgi:hypothetical protein
MLNSGAEQLSVIHQQLYKKVAAYMQKSGQKPGYSVAQLLQPLTPLGALSSFTLSIKKDEVRRVAGGLLASDSEELQWAAKQLYLAARQKWPREFEQPLETNDSPAALNSIISKMADQRLPHGFSIDESIKLLEARPRLEFDLLSESIYPYSSLSLDEISEEVSSWPYSQKYLTLKEAASQSEVLRKVVYKLDILSDHLILDKFLQVSKIKNFQLQAFTPRYGYDMPQLIDAAAADDLYDQAFDESLKIYSQLQAIDREDTAPYFTLLGHKLRWQINATSDDLRPVIQDTNLLKNPVIKTIGEKLAEAHPLLWDVISQGQAHALPPAPKGKARIKVASRRHGKPKKP